MVERAGGTFWCHFGASKYVTKNEENKILHCIRWPPDDKEHTKINQKNVDKMEEEWGRLIDREETQGESKYDDLGSIECR